MQGFKLRAADPRALLFLPHHAAMFCFVEMGRDTERTQSWMKELGAYQIQNVPELCPNCLGVLQSLQATCSAKKWAKGTQMGKHFHQKGNQFIFKKCSRFFSCPSSPRSHSFSAPHQEQVEVSCTFFFFFPETSRVTKIPEIYLNGDRSVLRN